MARTVDLVVRGDGRTAFAAVIDALQRGRRVLVVLRSRDTGAARRFRRGLGRAANANDSQLAVMANAEVVCVDGIDAVEAVVIRRMRTGCLCAVNASAFLSCDEHDEVSGVSDRCNLGTRARRTYRKSR